MTLEALRGDLTVAEIAGKYQIHHPLSETEPATKQISIWKFDRGHYIVIDEEEHGF